MSKTHFRNKSIKIGAMSLIWLINPVFVGGCDEKSFEFEEEDMIALAETIDNGSWTANIDGQDYELEFIVSTDSMEAGLSQAGLSLGSAWACEERSFVASAAACIDTTELHIDGFLRVTEGDSNVVIIDNAPIEGLMSVMGLRLDNAELTFNLGDDGFVRFESTDGKAFELNTVELQIEN